MREEKHAERQEKVRNKERDKRRGKYNRTQQTGEKQSGKRRFA